VLRQAQHDRIVVIFVLKNGHPELVEGLLLIWATARTIVDPCILTSHFEVVLVEAVFFDEN